MANLIAYQDTNLHNGQAKLPQTVSEPVADCSGGADCFYCACPETD
jgi:hypothetical protein